MSAFIVQDKTINRVVNLLVQEIRKNPESSNLKENLSKLGYDLSDNTFAEKLAEDMFALNVSAVRQRYSEKEEAPEFTYVEGHSASPIQTFKSLSCWLYQCTEGDVPASGLYKFFTDVFQNYLLKRIVYKLPEFDKAEWA